VRDHLIHTHSLHDEAGGFSNLGEICQAMARRSRPLTMMLLACALFLRVWVPAGWMPASGGNAFAIELCPSVSDPVTHASHHDGSHKGQHDGNCAFAPLHSGLTASPSAAIVPTPLLATSAARGDHRTPFFPTGPPALPPPATGPPATA
jgi:hypothetical protein